MRWRQLAIALLVLPIACGGVGVREEFRGVSQPVPPGAVEPDPGIPTLTATNAEGETILVQAYGWAQIEGSAGSGARDAEQLIVTGERWLTLEVPYPGVAVILTANGVPRTAKVEPLGEGRFRLPILGPGVWQVDVLATLGADYATFAFTVEVG
ncbi:MAG TPA: hypothetical protein VJR05_06190 [Acidimicrobiia bacterium]|nr:hypothetical protein [Acidimicrobiia bacterium]